MSQVNNNLSSKSSGAITLVPPIGYYMIDDGIYRAIGPFSVLNVPFLNTLHLKTIIGLGFKDGLDKNTINILRNDLNIEHIINYPIDLSQCSMHDSEMKIKEVLMFLLDSAQYPLLMIAPPAHFNRNTNNGSHVYNNRNKTGHIHSTHINSNDLIINYADLAVLGCLRRLQRVDIVSVHWEIQLCLMNRNRQLEQFIEYIDLMDLMGIIADSVSKQCIDDKSNTPEIDMDKIIDMDMVENKNGNDNDSPEVLTSSGNSSYHRFHTDSYSHGISMDSNIPLVIPQYIAAFYKKTFNAAHISSNYFREGCNGLNEMQNANICEDTSGKNVDNVDRGNTLTADKGMIDVTALTDVESLILDILREEDQHGDRMDTKRINEDTNENTSVFVDDLPRESAPPHGCRFQLLTPYSTYDRTLR